MKTRETEIRINSGVLILVYVALISVLYLCSCAHLPGLQRPKPDCTSRCGANLYGRGNYRGTCEDFQALESRIIAVFPSETCAELRGVTIGVQATDSWVDEWGRSVGGVTRCNYRSVQVGPTLAGLAHEAAHVLDCPKEDSEHKTWPVWVWRAIDEANTPPAVVSP